MTASARPDAWERIAGALEELAAREAAAVAGVDYDAMADILARAEPLVAYLRAHRAEASTREREERLARIISCRAATYDSFTRRLADVEAELRSLAGHRRRLAQMGPVYAGADRQGVRQLEECG